MNVEEWLTEHRDRWQIGDTQWFLLNQLLNDYRSQMEDEMANDTLGIGEIRFLCKHCSKPITDEGHTYEKCSHCNGRGYYIESTCDNEEHDETIGCPYCVQGEVRVRTCIGVDRPFSLEGMQY